MGTDGQGDTNGRVFTAVTKSNRRPVPKIPCRDRTAGRRNQESVVPVPPIVLLVHRVYTSVFMYTHRALAVLMYMYIRGRTPNTQIFPRNEKRKRKQTKKGSPPNWPRGMQRGRTHDSSYPPSVNERELGEHSWKKINKKGQWVEECFLSLSVCDGSLS